jgi:hypothetical protein
MDNLLRRCGLGTAVFCYLVKTITPRMRPRADPRPNSSFSPVSIQEPLARDAVTWYKPAEVPRPCMTLAPTIAKPDDIAPQLAAGAYIGTSFSPEKRGEQRQKEYAEDVNGFYAELWPFAKTEQQKALLAEEMERYRLGYLSRMTAYLHSHTNVVSSMIAGPAGFPITRMQKRGQSADNKLNDLLEWRARARKAIKEKLLDAGPEEEKQAIAWRALERDLRGSLGTISAIDDGNSPYTRSSFVNSIVGKVERLANNGEVALVEKALALITDYNAHHPKPAISSRNSFWTLAETAREKAKALDAKIDKDPETVAKTDGIDIINNHHLDRVQIVFAAKPDSVMLGKLKQEGWHWSRMEGAWQRKLTEAAMASAKRITGL